MNDRYRYLGDRVSVGDGSELVRPWAGGQPVRVPTAVVDQAERCDRFATLDAHADALVATLGVDPARRVDLRGMLGHLVEDGVLVSEREVARSVGRSGSADPEPIAALGVVTCDRPQALRRGLESFVSVHRRTGRSLEVAIFDDSGPGPSAANREVLASLSGVGVRYAGRDEKHAYRQALVGQGHDPETVAFALSDPEGAGLPIGANRNALLLDAVGECVVSVDDDIVARTFAPACLRPGLAVADENPLDIEFLDDRASVLAGGVEDPEADPIGIHQQWLGRSVGAGAASLDLDGASPGLLRVLRDGATVAATQLGYAGDSGMSGGGAWLLALEGELRERLVVPAAAYARATTRREVIRLARRWTVSGSDHFMTGCVGLDHRRVLPPFFPVGRNEDLLFATLLRRSDPGALIGYAPRAILHAPWEPRPPEALLQGAGVVSDAEIVLTAIASVSWAPCPGPEAWFRRAGAHLGELSAVPVAAFGRWLRDAAWRHLGAQLDHLHRLLETFGGEPEHWAADVRRMRDAIVEQRRADPVPPDRAERLRVRVGRFGRLLAAWPDLRESAAALRRRGVRVAR